MREYNSKVSAESIHSVRIARGQGIYAAIVDMLEMEQAAWVSSMVASDATDEILRCQGAIRAINDIMRKIQ